MKPNEPSLSEKITMDEDLSIFIHQNMDTVFQRYLMTMEGARLNKAQRSPTDKFGTKIGHIYHQVFQSTKKDFHSFWYKAAVEFIHKLFQDSIENINVLKQRLEEETTYSNQDKIVEELNAKKRAAEAEAAAEIATSTEIPATPTQPAVASIRDKMRSQTNRAITVTIPAGPGTKKATPNSPKPPKGVHPLATLADDGVWETDATALLDLDTENDEESSTIPQNQPHTAARRARPPRAARH